MAWFRFYNTKIQGQFEAADMKEAVWKLNNSEHTKNKYWDIEEIPAPFKQTSKLKKHNK